MNQLLKLDGIMADGDVKLQRKIQVINFDLEFKVDTGFSNWLLQKTHFFSWCWTFIFSKVQRVQKYVETLDMLKIKNSMANGNGNHAPTQQQHKHSNGQKLASIQKRQPRYTNGHTLIPIEEEEEQRHPFGHSSIHQQQQPSRRSASGEVVVTTQWETFDSTPALEPLPSISTSSTATKTSAHQPKFPWDFVN